MTRNHDRCDQLVWDNDLGWIDPENILQSLGVTKVERADRWNFYRAGKFILVVDKNANIPVLKECLEELHSAETQS